MDRSSTTSWVWKMLISLRPLAKMFFRVSIGDGKATSFWFDHWTSQGPLIDLLSHNAPQTSGISLHSTVHDVCGILGWKLPSARSRSPILKHLRHLATDPPSIDRGPNSFSWNTGTVSRHSFSTSHTWNHLRPFGQIEQWAKLIWFKGHIPKLAFTFWVSHLNRLPTRSRLFSWGVSSTDHCCTCKLQRETRDHLLLHCDFNEQIWGTVLKRLGQPPFIFAEWSVLINWLSSASPNVSLTLKRVAVHATIYLLWKERNNRLHNKVSSTASTVFNQIDRLVRDIILARREHPDFKTLLQQWFAHE
ncbi:unnamed protein product [Arabidopsis halleri]